MTMRMLEASIFAKSKNRDLGWFAAVDDLGFTKVGSTREYVNRGSGCVGVLAITYGANLMGQ